MIYERPALRLSGRQVVARDAGQTGCLVKTRAAAWRPLRRNPKGRVCLPACPRHHSVVYRHTRPRSSLACAQTAPGAGHSQIIDRLLNPCCRSSVTTARNRGVKLIRNARIHDGSGAVS